MEPKKEPSNTMIYVSNLPFDTNDEELKELFKGFGIKTAYVARRKNGKSKGFGFVNLEKESDQKSAIEKVNGRDFSSRKLIARVAMNDDRRNEKGELKEEFKTQQNNQVASETVVYVSNLAWTVRDEDLKKIFAEFNPKVVTVATRRSGRSKGFGFVEFNNKEDREKALSLDQKSFNERTVTVKPSTGYRGDRQRDRSRNRSRDNRRRSRDNRNRSRDNNRRRSRDNRNRSRDNNRRSRENRNRSRDNNRRSRENRQNNNENRTVENKNNNTTTTNNNTNHKQNENKPKETKQNTHKQNENKPKENNNSHKQNENKPKETTPKEKSNNNTNNNNKPKTTNKTKNFGKVVSNNRRTNKSKKQETKTNNNNNEVTTKTTSNTSTNKTTNEKPREKRNEFTLYVNNLPFELDDTDLKDVFAEFHPKSARIATTNSGRSKGYGFVEFNNSKDQNDALRALDQSEINDRLVTVKLSSPKERERRRNRRSRSRSRSRSPSKREPSTTTVHVSNLEFSIDDNDLEEIFKGLQITKAYVVKNQNGRSKGFGFVEFSNSEDQQKSLQKTGNEIKGRTIRVQASFVRDN